MEYLGRNTERFKTVQVLNDLTVEKVLFVSNINNTYPTAGQILTWDGTMITWKDDSNTTYVAATSSVLGLLKIEDDAEQSVTANAVTATAGRTYGIQFNASDQAVVNVPWTDTNTTYSAGDLLDLSTTTFNVDLTEAAAATIAAGDNIIFLDGGATGTQSKGSINDVATLFAGSAATTGLSASSGVMSVSDLHPVGVDGSANQLLTDDGDGTVTSEANITADSTATSGTMLALDAGAVTTGEGIEITDATYERASHLSFNITDTYTTTINRSLSSFIKMRYERPSGSPIASGQTVETTAIDIFMDDNAINVGNGSKTGLNIKVDNTSDAGTVKNHGIVTNVGGADTNYDIKMFNFADTTEYATVNCYTGGALDITTVSDDATGHLNLIADGAINATITDQSSFSIINSSGSNTAFKFYVDDGSETAFSMYSAGGSSPANYLEIKVEDPGETVIKTVDGSGTAAHLKLEADGDIILDSADNIELNADGGSIAFKDNTVTFGTIDSSSVFMKQTKVTLSESDCNSLHTTPITLVAAPGANQIIVPVNYLLLVDRDASTAQSASACDMMISYDGSTTGGKYLGYMRRFMYNESGDRTYVINGNNSTSTENWDTNDPSNKPLKIAFDSACTSGSLDSIVVYTTYYIVDNS